MELDLQSTLAGEFLLEREPGDCKEPVEAPGGGGSKGHSDVADVKRICLCRVGEGNWTLTGRVEDRKHVDTECNTSNSRGGSSLSGINPETEPGKEEANGHTRESGKQEVSATKGIDGVDGGQGEEEVDNSEAKGGQKSVQMTEAGVDEDRGGVVCDYVNCGVDR